MGVANTPLLGCNAATSLDMNGVESLTKVGSAITNVKKGDRVVASFQIA